MLAYFSHPFRCVKPFRAIGALLAVWLNVAPAQAAEILKVGVVTSLSDSQASRGQDFLEGFKLALRTWSGRLGGVEVELIVVDDQSKPDMAAHAARRLVERDHVHILSGPVTIESVLAVAQAVKGENSPLFISPAYGPAELAGSDCRQGFFSLVPSDDMLAEATVRQLKGDAAQPVLAAAIPAADGPAKSRAELLKSHFPEMTLVAAASGELVFDRHMQAIRQANPGGIAVYLSGGVGIGFLRQLKAWDLKESRLIYADWPLTEPSHLTALGDAAVGLRSIAPWADDAENPVSHKFVADYEEDHRHLPSGFAALGYDLALILDQAIKNQGGKVVERNQFARAIANSQLMTTRGQLRFANNHFALAPLHLREGIRDSKGRLIAVHRSGVSVHPDRQAASCHLAAPEGAPPEPVPEPGKKRR